jgi:hypothetical protein
MKYTGAHENDRTAPVNSCSPPLFVWYGGSRMEYTGGGGGTRGNDGNNGGAPGRPRAAFSRMVRSAPAQGSVALSLQK